MKSVLPAVLLLVLAPIVSCGAPAGDPAEELASIDAARHESEVIAPRTRINADDVPAFAVVLAGGQGTAEPSADGERDPEIPGGPFADVASFCATQKAAFAARVGFAWLELRDLGYDEAPAPTCAEDPSKLAGTRITLAPPFDAVAAVTYEAGFTTDTALLVHGARGWTPVRAPLLRTAHDDPGCGSIVRDRDIEEVRVTGDGVLVVVTTVDRAWGEDAGIVIARARGCRASSDGAAVACGEPATVSASVVAAGSGDATAKPRVVFETSYDVTASGAIQPARTFDGDPTAY